MAPASTIARTTFLAVALLLWALVFGELFLRLFAPQALMPRYVTGTPFGIRGNIPGAHYHHSTPDVETDYRINRQGMRDDHDVAVAKPSGVCRVALLGDSYFVGYELALPDTFAKRLERLLRADGYRIEVLDFAVSGFGTAENLRTYQSIARRYAPDLVLMQWQVTDYDDNVRSDLYRLDGERLVPGAPSFLPGIATQDHLMRSPLYRALADHSHLYNFAREQIGWRSKQLLAFVRKRAAGPSDSESEQNSYIINDRQVALAAALLAEAEAEVRRDRARMMVVDIPNRTPERVFSSSYDLMPAATRQTIPWVSVVPPFRKAAQDPAVQLFYRHGARHLTPLGAAILARESERRILAQRMLPRCEPDRAGARP